jgi:hypothetical protein
MGYKIEILINKTPHSNSINSPKPVTKHTRKKVILNDGVIVATKPN